MPARRTTIRPATYDADHKTLVAIAKQHKHTKDFSNMIFSGRDCYAAGRIRVAVQHNIGIVGFTCFRHRIHDPATVLYFIAIDSNQHRRGVGRALMEDLEALATYGVELKVAKDNPAVQFYEELGYTCEGEAYNGTGWLMRKRKAPSPAVQQGGLR